MEINIGETKPQHITKPQNVTEESEKEICMGCSKYVETGVQCGSCYRWYHYKFEGATETEIKKLYREETHYTCKKVQNSESIIMWKNQHEFKERVVETIKRINERIMKEKEKIKIQFDQLKEHHQKDKQKQQIKDLKIQLQKVKDTGEILVKDNVEMKSKINTQEIILKQKEQEEKERKNELSEIKKEIEKIKGENLQQTKNSNIEKENNIKTTKSSKKRRIPWRNK